MKDIMIGPDVYARDYFKVNSFRAKEIREMIGRKQGVFTDAENYMRNSEKIARVSTTTYGEEHYALWFSGYLFGVASAVAVQQAERDEVTE